MRRRQLKRLRKRLKKLSTMNLARDALPMRLGPAQTKATAAWRPIEGDVPSSGANFTYRLVREALGQVRRREGRYLLRASLTESDPAKLRQFHPQLVEVEAAFKTLEGDLAIRPDFHQEPQRIEAHLHRVPRLLPARHARPAAESARPRPYPAKRAGEVRCGTGGRCLRAAPDGRKLSLTRYTQPEPELRLLLDKLGLTLPAPAPPEITAAEILRATPL